MKAKNALLTIALTLSLGVGSALARDLAEPARQIPQATWLWSKSSTAVSNSTAALATGHIDRAIRLATRALAKDAGPDRVIATHNLCLAWFAIDRPDTAEPYCIDAIVAVAGDSGLTVSQQVALLENIERVRREHPRGRALQIASRAVCD